MQPFMILSPQDHVFRRINELVDFSFVAQELAEKYCSDNGRMAIHPIHMFKYLFLKSMNSFQMSSGRTLQV